jgi:hypothetical protein
VLLIDCSIFVDTMIEDGATDGMVVALGLLDDCRVIRGLLEENIVERYLPSLGGVLMFW